MNYCSDWPITKLSLAHLHGEASGISEARHLSKLLNCKAPGWGDTAHPLWSSNPSMNLCFPGGGLHQRRLLFWQPRSNWGGDAKQMTAPPHGTRSRISSGRPSCLAMELLGASQLLYIHTTCKNLFFRLYDLHSNSYLCAVAQNCRNITPRQSDSI